ncbi:hypothetical protein [Cellulomonas carbonis]|uniref:hypothetical protein n=1 Tax=Cellulomonas carbonis TaxID=1386092 RepID=UPI0016675EBF|nr:hypothetical protein [Cellulomonas carbonis]
MRHRAGDDDGAAADDDADAGAVAVRDAAADDDATAGGADGAGSTQERLVGVARELYALPAGDFTAARDRIAKEVRSEGDRELAALVAGLRRPTTAAWAVNLLVRTHPDEVERLLELGAALREAQATLAGHELRALGKQQHQVLAGFRRQVRAAAVDAGQRLSDTVTQQVEATLRAAMADPRAADAVRSGLLTTHLESIGFAPVDVDGAVAVPEGVGGAGDGAGGGGGAGAADGEAPRDGVAPRDGATRGGAEQSSGERVDRARTAHAERGSADRAEKDRAEQERAEQEREEHERRERERAEREQREREQRERERRAAENAVREAAAASERADAAAGDAASRLDDVVAHRAEAEARVEQLEQELAAARDELARLTDEHRGLRAEARAADKERAAAVRALTAARSALDALG